jgi:hypothetical protein
VHWLGGAVGGRVRIPGEEKKLSWNFEFDFRQKSLKKKRLEKLKKRCGWKN